MALGLAWFELGEASRPMMAMTTWIGPSANTRAARYSQTGNRRAAPANQGSPAAATSDNGWMIRDSV